LGLFEGKCVIKDCGFTESERKRRKRVPFWLVAQRTRGESKRTGREQTRGIMSENKQDGRIILENLATALIRRDFKLHLAE
jgi:hypothetical protein